MQRISVDAFRETLAAERNNPTVAFINVCTPEEYQQKHIEGVASMPLDDLARRVGELADKRTVYVHCRSGNRSAKAITELQKLGVQAELVNVEGGLLAWESAGFVTRSIRGGIPLTRQVFIAAGLLVLAGTLLGAFIHPLWLFVPGFVGMGLTFAGVTGWCGMAMLLSRMPWNRS